jgi:5'-nucleotidase/UDP-sugar diphosphatase
VALLVFLEKLNYSFKTMNPISKKALLGIGAIFILSGFLFSENSRKSLTIIHTNDLHSHFLGFSPNIEYTPQTTGDDSTVGGWTRIATVIAGIKKDRKHPVLVCDAGDFLMGSLFHLLTRERAFELQLLDKMDYDILTLGNHEFDLKPEGLAIILESASDLDVCPPIVLSNLLFSQDNDKDDALEDIYKRGIIQSYRVLEKEGLRIGVFGLMGINAAEVAPFADPVSFGNPLEAARRIVQILRENERVDGVVCLSHSGLWEETKKSEDEILAREVEGIDIILSGHTHTLLEAPIVINDTLIVQAGAYGKNVGVLDVVLEDGRVYLVDYKSVNIDDSIKGDESISELIQSFEREIDETVFPDEGLSFRKIIAHTDFDLIIEEDESPLGNLVADSIRWSINSLDSVQGDPNSRVTVGVMSNGLIRDDVKKGITGDLALCDIFRAVPLGIGLDGSMGYPLLTVYLFASEIKKALEVLTSIYPIKGSDFFLQISGIKFAYNPNRMIFDRVTDVWIEDAYGDYIPLNTSRSNKSLYRVGADFYNASFLKYVGDFTMQILKIVPKDSAGSPIEDLKTALVDADHETPGVQELKEWKAFVDYIRSFPDTDGDGLPEIADRYRDKEGRIVDEKSWNLIKLLRRGTYVTWIPMLVLIIFLSGLFFLLRVVVRKFKSRSAS